MANAITLNSHAGLTGVFDRLRQMLADYRVYSETRDELNALDDRALADIGLSRSDVHDIARKVAYDR
jgi:uncharacterized protein YjiS (DUF1127 family)